MRQIAPTRDLLTKLDTKHPDILRAGASYLPTITEAWCSVPQSRAFAGRSRPQQAPGAVRSPREVMRKQAATPCSPRF